MIDLYSRFVKSNLTAYYVEDNYIADGDHMQEYESLPAFVGAVSSAIAKNFCDDDLAVLAAVFTQLGDSLALIAAARIKCANKRTDSGNEKEQKRFSPQKNAGNSKP